MKKSKWKAEYRRKEHLLSAIVKSVTKSVENAYEGANHTMF